MHTLPICREHSAHQFHEFWSSTCCTTIEGRLLFLRVVLASTEPIERPLANKKIATGPILMNRSSIFELVELYLMHLEDARF